MIFIHAADLHVGSWRDPRMKELGLIAFKKFIEEIKEIKPSFIVISGDLFHTPLPSIDALKIVVKGFKEIKEMKIPIFVIPGSHDYSVSGKTILEVLEETGIIKIVSRLEEGIENKKLKLFSYEDQEIGKVSICGMPGRMLGLEKSYFENIKIENGDGFNIFMFHSGIKELLPKNLKDIEGISINNLPKGFHYYAGGHIHIVKSYKMGGSLIVYPGALFPTNFSELWDLGTGSFMVVEVNKDGKKENEYEIKIKKVPILVKNTINLDVNVTGLDGEEATKKIIEEVKKQVILDSIVLLKIRGVLERGMIDFNKINRECEECKPYKILRNTSKLEKKGFKEVRIEEKPVKMIEEEVINANIGKWNKDLEKKMIRELISILSKEKHEGEKTATYEERLLEESEKIIEKFKEQEEEFKEEKEGIKEKV